MIKLNKKVADMLTIFLDCFFPEYYRESLGDDPQFSSVVTAIFRKLLKWPIFSLALIWISTVVFAIVRQVSFWALLPVSLLLTLLILLAGIILFLALMLVESVAKIPACLILHGRLPEGAENPIDAQITYLVHGEK